MAVYRVAADDEVHEAILMAAAAFEQFIAEAQREFAARVAAFHPTVRRIEQEMII